MISSAKKSKKRLKKPIVCLFIKINNYNLIWFISYMFRLNNILKAYVSWFNLKRNHSIFGCLSPVEYKNKVLIKLADLL